jgi:hypothetical protein
MDIKAFVLLKAKEAKKVRSIRKGIFSTEKCCAGEDG